MYKLIIISLLLIILICLFKNYNYETFDNNYKINAVLYINLAHRKDRKKHIENEFKNLKSLYKTIYRIDAIKHNNGAKGCAQSHIKALQYAKDNNFENALIVEDDLKFKIKNPVKIINNILDKLNNNYDVLMFSGNYNEKLQKTNIKNLSRPKNTKTTSCYLVNKHYYDKLIEVFSESYNNLDDIKNVPNIKKWAIDTNWFKLQKKDNWYIFFPTIAYQMSDYSDIEKKNVDYKV